MKGRRKHSALVKFINTDKQYPLIAAIAAGLYPFLFYYSNNYTLLNSWSRLVYFACFFLLLPMLVFYVAYRLSKLDVFKKLAPWLLPFLNGFTFLFFMSVALRGEIIAEISIPILAIALLLTFLLRKQFKKLVVLQLILATIGFISLVPNLIFQFNYSDAWRSQPDNIEQVVFKKKPNVYFIQPDGYVNFSEIGKGYYRVNNAEFKNYLVQEKFTLYPNFRSNYASTITTNSSIFMMKHHYYNRGLNFTETLQARDIIITENAVLNIFNNNGYKTHFLAERPYLLISRPSIGYDYCNYDYNDVEQINTGYKELREIIEPIRTLIKENPDQPKFFFMEIFAPGHIAVKRSKSKGIEEERVAWLKRLEESNKRLISLITTIKDNDPNALIVVMSDHGGFVGFNFMHQAYEKTEDRDLIYSIFSSFLAIHWPDSEEPNFTSSLKTSVNLFRILSAYLSEDDSYLSFLQDDISYIPILKGAPKGVYQYIDTLGNVNINKVYGKQ
jgi:hypothetical protein